MNIFILLPFISLHPFHIVQEVDNISPIISNCPQSASYTVPLGTTSRIVTWTEPTATDNNGGEVNIVMSHQPGQSFPQGTTEVTYTFTDAVGNLNTCSFIIMGRLNASCLLLAKKVEILHVGSN